MYRRAVALAYEAKAPNTVELSRQWLAAYPSPSSWQNSIAIYRNLRTTKSPDIVDILRLAMVTGALQQDLDYATLCGESRRAGQLWRGQGRGRRRNCRRQAEDPPINMSRR